jgi:hypothetical protein
VLINDQGLIGDHGLIGEQKLIRERAPGRGVMLVGRARCRSPVRW